MGSKKDKAEKQTVGYSYYMGLHMGIARALNAIVEIRVGDKQAWRGTWGSTGPFYIDAPEIFGGREGEGGVKGEFTLLQGDSDQVAPSKLRKMLTGDPEGRCPGFRGMVTAYFDGMYSQMNPYPKRWGFRVRRTTAVWPSPGVWYPEKILILMGKHRIEDYPDDEAPEDPENGLEAVHAMNPAHIILYLLLDPSTGRGLPRSAVDLGAFKVAADALYDEGFGLCLKWSRSGVVSDYVQIVLDHIGGALFQDRFTGLIRLKLIRDDYNPNSLPTYTVDTGILAIEQAETAAKPAIVNEIIIQYRNPVLQEEGSVRVQNLGAMQGDESVYSSSIDYPGLPTPELALRVGQRELRARGSGLRRFKLKCDRRAWTLQPGDVFKLRDDTRGIANTILRVIDYEDGSTNDNAITLTAVQDIYTFPLTEYTKPQPGEHIPQTPEPELARRIIYEVPYIWLRRTLPDILFERLTYTQGFLGAGAEQPSGLHLGYRITTKREGETDFTDTGNGSFIPLGEVAFPVDYFDTTIELILTSTTEFIEPGLCLMIGEEIIEVEDVVFAEVDLGGEPVDGSPVTLTVGRGVSDTRPWQHAPGVLAWFFDEAIGTDLYEYVGDEFVDVKIRPWTFLGGSYPIAQTPTDTLVFDYRFTRPYLPGRAQLDGEPWFVPSTVDADNTATVTWTHRDRLLQSDRLIQHQEGDVGPEPGSSYNVVVQNAAGDVIRDDQGITGTSWAYDQATALADLTLDQVNIDVDETVYLKLQTQRTTEGTVFDSWQNYEMALKVEAFKFYVWVAQYARVMAQDADYPSMLGLYLGQYSRAMAQDGGYRSMHGLYLGQCARPMAQETAFPRTPDRWVRERPYIDQKREGVSTTGHHLIAVAVQPSDLIPEHYDFLAAENPGAYDPVEEKYPPMISDMDLYQMQSATAPWAPWGILKGALDFEETRLVFSRTSSDTGQALGDLPYGTLVSVGAELMSVVAAGDDWLTVKRGTADTVPARHDAGIRAFAIQRGAAANRVADTRLYSDKAIVETKVREQSFAGPIGLDEIAADSTMIRDRVSRPYPPGNLRTDGKPWWEEVSRIEDEGDSVTVTWSDRNRITQGANAVGHPFGSIPREAGAAYRLRFLGPIPKGGDEPAVLHEEIVNGESWVLDYATARSIGYRAARMRDSCGTSGVTMTLFSVRDGLESWQGYTLRFALPAPECPAGVGNDGNFDGSGAGDPAGDGSYDGSHDNNNDHRPDKDEPDDDSDWPKPDRPPEPPEQPDPDPEDPNEDGKDGDGDGDGDDGPIGGKWSRGWANRWGTVKKGNKTP